MNTKPQEQQHLSWRHHFIRGALAGALILAASSGHAKLLTWNLQDVRFDDGGTATGFFVFDPTSACSSGNCSNVVPSADIKTTGFGFYHQYGAGQ